MATQPVSAAAQSTPAAEGAATAAARTFPATADQVGEARRFLAVQIGDLPLADDALMCLSELVTNSIQHSHSSRPSGQLTVRVALTRRALRVEVHDEGGPWAPGGGADGERGRGLLIVGQLATCWGTTPTAIGRTVWFTMAVGP